MSSINKVLIEIAQNLQANHWQMVTAESCTGGLVASSITEIPGSSLWFERGFVTYSNLSKQELLGVPAQLISEYGAVSEEVALAMAVGALAHSKGHIALSVTGIAGPDGGSIEKPVGTVCFGWAMQGREPETIRKQLAGNRQEIRMASCHIALEGILSLIRNDS